MYFIIPSCPAWLPRMLSITTGVDESKLDNVMAMSAQEIVRAIREGGEQADVTASQVTRARVGQFVVLKHTKQ